MPLDPQVFQILRQISVSGEQSFHTQSIEDARLSYQSQKGLAGQAEPVDQVHNRSIPGPYGEIPIRVYSPKGETPFPVLLYFHGGGWVLGNLDTADAICRSLANQAGCIVVSVDYRLAPEYKFPAAAEEAYTAIQWIAQHASSMGADPNRMAVGGDSAGGNLAAVAALMARDRKAPRLLHQLLVYPVTHYSFDTVSYQENGNGYLLSKNDMIWFWDHYLQNESDGKHSYASPLLSENLVGLPPATVITAEFDPLRDEGEAYANRLREAGNHVIHTRYNGMVHGFFRMAGLLDQGRNALLEVSTALRAAFERGNGEKSID